MLMGCDLANPIISQPPRLQMSYTNPMVGVLMSMAQIWIVGILMIPDTLSHFDRAAAGRPAASAVSATPCT